MYVKWIWIAVKLLLQQQAILLIHLVICVADVKSLKRYIMQIMEFSAIVWVILKRAIYFDNLRVITFTYSSQRQHNPDNTRHWPNLFVVIFALFSYCIFIFPRKHQTTLCCSLNVPLLLKISSIIYSPEAVSQWRPLITFSKHTTWKIIQL